MTLSLNGLEVSCVIGDLAWERTREQTLLIDLELGISDAAAETDDLKDTVDYVTLAGRIRTALQAAKCRMIERAAKVVRDTVLEDTRIRAATVRVTKRAPIDGLASATAELGNYL